MALTIYVVLRADAQMAREFARLIDPVVCALTGKGVVVCREEQYSDGLLDVRAPVTPEMAQAIHRLRMIHPADEITLEWVLQVLRRDANVGSLADGGGTADPLDRSGDRERSVGA